MAQFSMSVEGVSLDVTGLRKGNEITKTMKSGTLLINGISRTPFILQKLIRGKFDIGQQIDNFTIHIFDQRKTKFTKQGYVSVLLTTQSLQVKLYIKKRHIQGFVFQVCYEFVE